MSADFVTELDFAIFLTKFLRLSLVFIISLALSVWSLAVETLPVADLWSFCECFFFPTHVQCVVNNSAGSIVFHDVI